jgi:predicted transposase YbfD/YdcC
LTSSEPSHRNRSITMDQADQGILTVPDGLSPGLRRLLFVHETTFQFDDVDPSHPTALAAVNRALVDGHRVVREIWVTPANDTITFPGATQIFRIRRRVFERTGQCLSKEIVHGITSLTSRRANPADLATFVRHHWLIESNHWLRDTPYREDHRYAHTGSGAHALAAIRNLALGILRLAHVTKIRATLQQHATDRTKITRLLTQVTNPQPMIN